MLTAAKTDGKKKSGAASTFDKQPDNAAQKSFAPYKKRRIPPPHPSPAARPHDQIIPRGLPPRPRKELYAANPPQQRKITIPCLAPIIHEQQPAATTTKRSLPTASTVTSTLRAVLRDLGSDVALHGAGIPSSGSLVNFLPLMKICLANEVEHKKVDNH